MEEKNINQILEEIKSVDSNVSGILVPILKDTIADYRKIVFKLIFIIVILIIGIVGVSVYSQTMISKQIEKFNSFSNEMIQKYNDFLSQFEYETTDYVYTQDSSATNGDSTINDGITINP